MVNNDYVYEMLAKFKKQEIEKAAQDAWKFTSIKQESIFQKMKRKVTGSIEKRNSNTEPCCCTVC